jgi:hypothetical protein
MNIRSYMLLDIYDYVMTLLNNNRVNSFYLITQLL